jgi:hypothetical protein
MKPTCLILAAFTVIWVLGASGCAKSAPISAREPEDGGLPIDTDVMAYLSLARSLHHQANVREDSNDLPGAIAPLERLVREQEPHRGTRVPEVEEVLADTYARLAELRLRNRDVEEASQDVRAGLSHAPESTYFRGHLLEVEGVLEETRAAQLFDAGRAEEATRARARAFDLLNQAVEVQEQVVTKSLGDEAGAEGGRK